MASKLKWSQQEENVLKKLAACQSRRKWVDIAEQINQKFPQRQRTSKQCREKFINHVQYGEDADMIRWTVQDQHLLFQQYLVKGSQWKLISGFLPGKSENAVKNKFYGKVRKLVRKLNNICKERINRSNKPLRDQSIMRIIDVQEGFENLPEHLISQSVQLKGQLLSLAQKQMTEFQSWDLLDQTNVVNLIRKIHKFNINSRYYCSRKKKSSTVKKISKLKPKQESFDAKMTIMDENQNGSEDEDENGEVENQKVIPFIPIIIINANSCQQDC